MFKSFFILFIISSFISSCTQGQKPQHKNILKNPNKLVGFKTMHFIPEGISQIGSNTGNEDEKPVHNTKIRAFYMDETPITYSDFTKYVEAGGTKSRYWNYDTYNQPENPVTGIDWFHAINYCNWRSTIENLKPAYYKTEKKDKWGFTIWELDTSSNGYRLPTEDEFEYAARGGKTGEDYPWGNQFDENLANYDNERGVMKPKWWRLAKVKEQFQNGYNLYGMSGNIWHFCTNWYNAKSYQNMDSFLSQNDVKALRGGSWGSTSAFYLRVSYRSHTSPGNFNYDIGFRCVRSAKSTEDSIQKTDLNLAKNFEFYTYKLETGEEINMDFTSEEFKKKLGEYIGDFYPECLYFHEKIDGQQILTPFQMACLISEECVKNRINPLFLTGIMISESGFATVSFPRWYNNPMAYHWQNDNMKRGLPKYTQPSVYYNIKYKDLRAAIRDYSNVKRPLYYEASKGTLRKFHRIYMGYIAEEWMFTLSRIFRDLCGVKIEPDFPENIGKYIYLDWKYREK